MATRHRDTPPQQPYQHSWSESEDLVEQRFTEAGYRVSLPAIPRLLPYDLIVDVKGQLVKLQVKRARWEDPRRHRSGLWGDRGGFYVDLGRHKRPATKRHYFKRLSRTEFDYLCVVCDERTIYVIPVGRLLRAPGSDELLRRIIFKPPPTNNRTDSLAAYQRWLPYLNRFDLAVESV